MRTETGTSESTGAMAEAFSKVGVKSPEKLAMEMLDRHWKELKPDVAKTLTSFANELRELSPILMAVIGETAFLARVRSFAMGQTQVRGSGHPEIKGAVLAAAGRLANKRRMTGVALSTNPATIRHRRWRHNKKLNAPVDELPSDLGDSAMPDWAEVSGRSNQNRQEANREHYQRERQGIVRVKLDVDPRTGTVALSGRLPLSIRNLLLNGIPILECTKEQALKWCEMRKAQTRLVEVWCSLVADPRKTLGEQLTAEIVGELIKAAE